MSVEWCPSHEEEAAVQSGLISPWHYVANYVADKFAEKAAASANMADHFADSIPFWERRAQQVRKRLVAAHRLFFNELASQDGKRKRVDPSGDPLPKRTCNNALPNNKTYYDNHRFDVDAMVSQSSHSIVKNSVKRWSCGRCFSFSDPRYSTLEGWIASQCTPKKPPWLHASHAYLFRDPWHLCTRCGAHWRN